MISDLLSSMGEGSTLGPLLAFAAGGVLGLSPVALPTLPVVVGAVSPGRVDERGRRLLPRLLRLSPVVLAFVVGVDGVIGLLGFLFVALTEALTRASGALYLVAGGLMAAVGLRLVFGRSSVCRRVAGTLPPTPGQALAFGVAFSFGGCPGCGPIVLGVGGAASAVGGPLYGLLILAAFVLGHAAVLLAAAGVGSRLLPSDTSKVPWGRMDTVVGALFLAAAGYYLYQVLSGALVTVPAGEPGSPVLP